VRKTYNAALSYLNTQRKKKGKKGKRPELSQYTLRDRFVTAASIPKEMSYLLDCPKHVRDGALEDLVAAFKTNYQKLKLDAKHKFEVKFRSKKADEQAIVIPPDSIKKILMDKKKCEEKQNDVWSVTMYPTYLKNAIKIRVRKQDTMIDNIVNQCRLQLDRLGRFYLCVPYKACALDNQGSCNAKLRHAYCSLDPGSRTFQTVYSPTTGVCFKLAHGDVQRLFRLCLHLDRLISKTSRQTTKRSRRACKKAQVRLRQRVKHLVSEVHWKVALFLVRTFEVIIIPKFETQSMVSKSRLRRINGSTARKLLTWSHYTFRQRLELKAKEHGSRVHVVTEECTTKTCGNCLMMHHTVGGNKVFKCPHCGIKADRDANGSRNIFLKNVTFHG
jgi:IS605 OrfB family transposase